MLSVSDHRSTFTVEGKALTASVVGGDLVIEGMAAVWDGLDRQGENFAPGAFSRGIKSFLNGQAGLCFHHKHEKLLGKVLDLRETPDGLWIRARVDGAIRKHPELATYYDQIKNGSLNALSVGGFFKRLGGKIVGVDFTEVSVTPVPVHPGTNFAVVEGKAVPLADTWADRLRTAELAAVRRDLHREILHAKLDAVAYS